MKFSDIIGQEELKAHFSLAIKKRKLSQAYMIEGEALSGKKMMARAFAAALLCENGGEEACGSCHSCRMIAAGSHPDLVFTTHEKPNQYTIEEIRSQVVEDVSLRPFYGGYKIYIIDEAEKITPRSQNALLKTLEDPPDYCIIILLCEGIDHFLSTVQSRCTKLRMAPLPDEEIKKRLTEKFGLPAYEANAILAFARGNLGKAENLAQSSGFSDMKRDVLGLLRHIDEVPLYIVLEEADALEEAYRDRMSELFELFLLWYRDAVVYKATGDSGLLVFSGGDESYAISQAARQLGYSKLIENAHSIGDARRLLSEHVSGAKVLEQLVLELRSKQGAYI